MLTADAKREFQLKITLLTVLIKTYDFNYRGSRASE